MICFAAPKGSSGYSSVCADEQKAAGVLGYTQVSWDNESGEEPQPASYDKFWTELTDEERAAAVSLGYTQAIWDQPAAGNKYWAELTSCGT